MSKIWQTALSTSRNSAVHLWSNIVIAVSAVVEAVAAFGDQIADLVGDPELKTQIVALVPHDSVPLVIIAIMVVTKLARNRTLPR